MDWKYSMKKLIMFCILPSVILLIVFITAASANILPKPKPFVNDNNSLIQYYIKQNEGLKQRVYLDTKGNLTVGYGHRVSNKYKIGDYVTMNQIDIWFKSDYQTALNCAKRFLKNDYRSNELTVITDMAFNLGCTNLHDFWRLRKHINNHDLHMSTHAIEGSDYYKQVKNRADRNILLLNQ